MLLLFLARVSELIDTLWNVNGLHDIWRNKSDWELIDTLWNVNFTQFKVVESKREGINRYIMECK